jgi:hypothetical protein
MYKLYKKQIHISGIIQKLRQIRLRTKDLNLDNSDFMPVFYFPWTFIF